MLQADDGSNPPVGGNSQQTKNNNEPPDDPFKGLDTDLLDEDGRKAIEEAKKRFLDLQGQAKTASAHQSRANALEQLAKEQQAVLQNLQTKAEPAPKTEEEEAIEALVKQNVPREVAVQIGKATAAVLKSNSESLAQKMRAEMQPMMAQVSIHQASSALHSLSHQSYMQDPEIVANLHSQAEQMVKAGQPVDANVLHNLALIEVGKKVMEGKITPKPAPTNPVATYVGMFGTPSFNGSMTQPQVQVKELSPELQAAMSSIEGKWATYTKKNKSK